MKSILSTLLITAMVLSANAQSPQYYMPHETEEHEGTWLAWPHDYTYGAGNRAASEQVWIDMTKELVKGENVHMIAYDQAEEDHILQVLINENIDTSKVDFFQFQTDDYWMRDNGPIYVYDQNDALYITDWDFNGWGNDAPFTKDELIPQQVSAATGVPRVDVTAVVLEGGSIEVDGFGSMLGCRSSITNNNRNPGLTEAEIEDYLADNLGITNFIWLDGTPGLEITDFHIDGFARFHNSDTILTLDSLDLIDWGTSVKDVTTLYSAQKPGGGDYEYVFLPQTQNNVTNFWGQPLGYKGSYINFYIGNECVLVPTYNDPNDQVAINILQDLYPNRNVVGIDVRRIYEFGGMIHCITQQQPVALSVTSIDVSIVDEKDFNVYPNPTRKRLIIEKDLVDQDYTIYDLQGRVVLKGRIAQRAIDVSGLNAGTYLLSIAGKNQKVRFIKVD